MTNRCVKICLWICACLLVSCDDRIAGGTNDETHTEVAARFLKPGGKESASGALVQVVKRDGTTLVASGRTDTAGRLVLDLIPDGIYTISVSQNGSVAFVDSVPAIKGILILEHNDTLGPVGSLGGVVQMQPNHDPATVTVNVLGTDIWANVNGDGNFRLDGLGAGTFRLRFATTLADYSTTYVRAKAKDGQATELSDTVRMIYTGIPVVTGIMVKNDTLTGDQILSWPSPKYRFTQDYVIYRDTINALSPSRLRYATVADTFWRDTGASRGLWVAKWKYRIALETMSGDTGRWFGSVSGTSVPRALSRLDRGVWSDAGRSWGGRLSDLNGMMTEIDVNRTAGSVDVGIRRSANGLLWDSCGVSLPVRKDGNALQWLVGTGAGKIWCLGHSLAGDGIQVRSSVDGQAWVSASLPDSLWPSLQDSLVWVGTDQRAGIESSNGRALLFLNGVWARDDLPRQILGATDSALYATGGGSHLLALEWKDRSQILSDEGIPPFVSPSSIVAWQGTLAAISGGRLWIRDQTSWTLRRPTGLNRMAVFGNQLIVSDSTGVLRTYQEGP